jgi:hypothetical protein
MKSGNCDIIIGLDDVSKDFYIIRGLSNVIGSGSTEIKTQLDLNVLAHFGIDLLIK